MIFNSIEDETGAALNQICRQRDDGFGCCGPLREPQCNYSTIFTTFSATATFHDAKCTHDGGQFVIPGTEIPATVNGFGVIFCDVDSASGGNRSLIRVYGVSGRQLSAASAPVLDNGLSFVGISFNAGERIARVVIESGNAALSATNDDGVNGADVVAMDDFIYGEPRAVGVSYWRFRRRWHHRFEHLPAVERTMVHAEQWKQHDQHSPVGSEW